MVEKSHAEFLGLDKREIKILESIKRQSKSMFALSDEVHVPRATLYPIVEKLSQRGFIVSKRIGKRVVYQSTPTPELIARFSLIIEDLEWNNEQAALQKNANAQQEAPAEIIEEKKIVTSPPQKKRKWFGGLFGKK